MSNDFTMGADPEFACLNGRRLVNAYTLVSNGHNHEFGCDGNESTFEIRPKPSKCPLELVSNIRDIFVKATKTSPELLKYEWHAGSYKNTLPLGGHIHFGIARIPVNQDLRFRLNGYHLNYYCLVLARYVGVFNCLLEKRNALLLRYRRGYGSAEGYRSQSHGFEYRCPGSWLTSPYIAAAFLCLSKTVMWEIMNKDLKDQKEINSNVDLTGDSYNICTKCLEYNRLFQKDTGKKELLVMFPVIWEEITKMELYPKYKQYIDLLHFLVTNKLTWYNQGITMNVAWGLVAPKAGPKQIPLSLIWNKFVKLANQSTAYQMPPF